MSMRGGATGKHDAIIVGGGIGALIAAAYLARAGARVLLLEAGARLGAGAETVELAAGFRAPQASHNVFALDARAVRELKLARSGLEFAQTNMNCVVLRPNGQHIVLPRQDLGGRAAFAAKDDGEGRAYLAFHKQAMGFARRLRALWAGQLGDRPDDAASPDAASAIVRSLRLNDSDAELLDDLIRLSAAAYLDRWFESDALKAALAFDVFPSGLSPQEQGSALVLIWRYAQTSCGRQAAVSQLRGGPGALVSALMVAAREAGAELRLSAGVSSILVESRRAVGVTLENGEMLPASCVLTDLGAMETLLGLVPAEAVGFGTAATVPGPSRIGMAQLMLALSGPPPFVGLGPQDLQGRLVIVDRAEIAAEAKGAALAGLLPHEFVVEAAIPTAADPALAPAGSHVLSVVVPYMPLSVSGGWDVQREVLRKRVIGALESLAPGLKDRIVAHRVVTPEDRADGACATPMCGSPLARLLATYESRIRTPIAGLYLCGTAAEPVGVPGGSAGRLAAAMAVADGRIREAGP